MDKPKLLDLYCCAGGAARGYQRAGFHVTGVDVNPQPRYAGDVFIQADALAYVAQYGWMYDAIHASPPCQKHSKLRNVQKKERVEEYEDLIPHTRFMLEALGVPYVIENAALRRSGLRNPITLCGAYFGLKVYRHRQFESNVFIFQPPHQPHDDQTPNTGLGISPKGFMTVTGVYGAAKGADYGGVGYDEYAAVAMGIDWMTRAELAQALPPAFTEYIGRQLMTHVQAYREAV